MTRAGSVAKTAFNTFRSVTKRSPQSSGSEQVASVEDHPSPPNSQFSSQFAFLAREEQKASEEGEPSSPDIESTPVRALSTLTAKELAAVLSFSDHAQYAALCLEVPLTGADVSHCQEADLEEIGITFRPHRLSFLALVKKLQAEGVPVTMLESAIGAEHQEPEWLAAATEALTTAPAASEVEICELEGREEPAWLAAAQEDVDRAGSIVADQECSGNDTEDSCADKSEHPPDDLLQTGEEPDWLAAAHDSLGDASVAAEQQQLEQQQMAERLERAWADAKDLSEAKHALAERDAELIAARNEAAAALKKLNEELAELAASCKLELDQQQKAHLAAISAIRVEYEQMEMEALKHMSEKCSAEQASALEELRMRLEGEHDLQLTHLRDEMQDLKKELREGKRAVEEARQLQTAAEEELAAHIDLGTNQLDESREPFEAPAEIGEEPDWLSAAQEGLGDGADAAEQEQRREQQLNERLELERKDSDKDARLLSEAMHALAQRETELLIARQEVLTAKKEAEEARTEVAAANKEADETTTKSGSEKEAAGPAPWHNWLFGQKPAASPTNDDTVDESGGGPSEDSGNVDTSVSNEGPEWLASELDHLSDTLGPAEQQHRREEQLTKRLNDLAEKRHGWQETAKARAAARQLSQAVHALAACESKLDVAHKEAEKAKEQLIERDRKLASAHKEAAAAKRKSDAAKVTLAEAKKAAERDLQVTKKEASKELQAVNEAAAKELEAAKAAAARELQTERDRLNRAARENILAALSEAADAKAQAAHAKETATREAQQEVDKIRAQSSGAARNLHLAIIKLVERDAEMVSARKETARARKQLMLLQKQADKLTDDLEEAERRASRAEGPAPWGLDLPGLGNIVLPQIQFDSPAKPKGEPNRRHSGPI